MINQAPNSNDPQQNKELLKNKKKKSALDTFFPPVWLLTIMVALVLFLNLIAGWKIFSLENERQDVEIRQAKVEFYEEIIKDIEEKEDRLRVLKQELPLRELKAEHAEKRAIEAEKRVIDGNSKLDQAKVELNKAIFDQKKAEENVKAAQEDIAVIRDDKKAQREEKFSLSQEVQDLRKERGRLEQNIKDKGIELRKEEEELVAIQFRLQEQNKMLKEVARVNSDFEEIRRQLTKMTAALDTTQQNMNFSTEDYKKTVALIRDGNDQLTGQTKYLKMTTEAISATHSSIKDTEDTIKNISRELSVSNTSIHEYTKALGNSVDNLHSISENLDKDVAQINNNISSFREKLNTLANNSIELQKTESELKNLVSGIVLQKNALTESASNLSRMPDFKDRINSFNVLLENVKKTNDNFVKLVSSVETDLSSTSGGVISVLQGVEQDLRGLSSSLSNIKKVIAETENQGQITAPVSKAN